MWSEARNIYNLNNRKVARATKKAEWKSVLTFRASSLPVREKHHPPLPTRRFASLSTDGNFCRIHDHRDQSLPPKKIPPPRISYSSYVPEFVINKTIRDLFKTRTGGINGQFLISRDLFWISFNPSLFLF